MTPKAQVISAKLNKWDYIKIKTQHNEGNNQQNEKISREWDKYFQTIYLINS